MGGNEDAKRDPGQYLGRKPERAAESIPGGERRGSGALVNVFD